MDESTAVEPTATYEDLAGLMEYALLGSALTEEQAALGCERAKAYGVAAVIVRPCDVDAAARWMAGSAVRLATVVDAPWGHMTTAAKTYATRDALRRGAREVDTTMNTGKLVSRQFQYLETELLQMVEACRAEGALLKVNLETAPLNDELRMVACRICRRAGAEFIGGESASDMELLKTHAREKLRLKARAGTADLTAALELRAAGCARIEVDDPGPALDAWKARLAEVSDQNRKFLIPPK